MTLFSITNYHWHICWMTCFIQFVRLSFPYWVDDGWSRIPDFWLKAARRVWAVSRGYLLLRGTGSYLCICRKSVMPYTRFCNCLLITITFYTLLNSLFCIIYYFISRSRIFHLYWDVTIAGEGLQNLGLCSTHRAFEQGGNFIVPHLLLNVMSFFPGSSEELPHSVVIYNTKRDVENLFLLESSRVPIQSPLTARKWMWRTYSNTDPHS
jgi:hypothetical protein